MVSQADQYVKGSGIARVGASNEAAYQALLAEWMRRYEKLEEERDALAAHVEMIEAHAKHCGWDNPETSILAMILDRGPITSLASLKAQWQLAAVEHCDKKGWMENKDWDVMYEIDDYKRELLKQAEGE